MWKRFRPYGYLLGAIALAGIVFALERPESPRVATEATVLFPGLLPDAVETIEIEQLLDGVRLERRASVWEVKTLQTDLQKEVIHAEHAAADKKEAAERSTADAQDAQASPESATEAGPFFRAEGDRVERLLTLLQTLQVGAAASRSADAHNTLQVGAVGLQVRVYGAMGKVLAHLYVGKQGPDYFSTYIRRSDDITSYLIRETLAGRFPTQLDAWRDKEVWALDADQVASIRIDRKDGGLVLERDPSDHFVATDAKATSLDDERLRGWFARWLQFDALEIVQGVSAEQAGLEKPAMTVTVTMKDGEMHTLLLGSESPRGALYGKRLEGNELVIIPQDVAQALRSDVESLTKDEG
ncbi:MAG: DUF4340 domain-containing protein [Deltaproteobacteria bacterium]|nr:DUF4340 domain-containing protein [Deltaproteobacteria bacterium]